MKRGTTTTALIIGIATSTPLLGFVGWSATSIISQGNQVAAVSASLEGINKHLDSIDETASKSSDALQIVNEKVTRQGVLLDLISPQLGINPGVVNIKLATSTH